VSFSGGECFLVFDRLVCWLSLFKRKLPHLYYWAYTNGLAADQEKLRRLADIGLDELRFNIAASGYDSRHLFEMIRFSTSFFPKVAVEIPSIPQDLDKILTVLPRLDELGVHYLNLHEYILTPGDPNIVGAASASFLLNGHIRMVYDTASRANTTKISRFIEEHGLNMTVNDCSLTLKENQMLQRRVMMGTLFKTEVETVTRDGFLASSLLSKRVLQVQEIQEAWAASEGFNDFSQHLCHPDKIEDPANAGQAVAMLYFVPPMSIDGRRMLYRIEIMDKGCRRYAQTLL
jgi:pyruvate formate-lyase activating enzyme-like uncharacterized protein